MKILQICNKPPFPPVDGGSIAMGSMLQSMIISGYTVNVFSMVSFKHPANETDFPAGLRKNIRLGFAKVDLRLKPVRAFLNLFSSRSYHAERFYSHDAAEKLIALLKSEQFDIIHMETVFPMVYHALIRKYSRAKIVIRLHNIEHEVWATTARAEKNFLRKRYLSLLAGRLQSFEQDAFRKADGIITISSADFQKIQLLCGNTPVANIPVGLDLSKYPVATPVNEFPCLFHLGAMDWIPNQQGMSWFLETAWQELKQKYPLLKFFIAGRKMPEKFIRMRDAQLLVEGEIESPPAFVQPKDILIAPLLSGSGIRVKIIEGMAFGKTIVTTSLGAAGIDCADGENILIANSPEVFVEKISGCIENREMISRIGGNARRLVEEKYSLPITATELDNFIKQVLS